ncbi:ParB/RepB/Spo0J family partition protein [Synechocystis sp. LEGE 06083]|uniref:ParB/RepB/Spo0J family partition protein n=1 Tax=Synechocystis sp. LEGE 06083 TaxID=915336 RepID=UPI00187E9CB4|nr:ParB/RepB/Spo0J family partition protein [Synechocystis sp. LEGE 06083]MBE9194353.1 ParB/RepB/Spo0J family partition protein [Synechocystis sp. LEGE 06083]
MAKRQSLDISKAQARSATSEAAEETLQRQQMKEGLVPLDKIGDRAEGDTRQINAKHVKELVESIQVLGLITPLTVDRHYRLLAGGHRKAALEKLAAESPETFTAFFGEGVPVNIMDIDAETATLTALQVEVEENTQRKNYTPSEIREAARKLKEAGYEQLKGRPSKGQKSINRELMSVFGASRRYITKILNDPEDEQQKQKSAHMCALFSKIKRYHEQTEAFKDYISKNSPKDAINPELNLIRLSLIEKLKETQALLEGLHTVEQLQTKATSPSIAGKNHSTQEEELEI